MSCFFRLCALCAVLTALSGCALFGPTTPQQAIAGLTETHSGGIFNRLNASPVVVRVTIAGPVSRKAVVGGDDVLFSYQDAVVLRAPADETGCVSPLYFGGDRFVAGQKNPAFMRLLVPGNTPAFGEGTVLFLSGARDEAGAVDLDAVLPVKNAQQSEALADGFRTLNPMNFEFEKQAGRTVIPATFTLHAEIEAPDWQFQAVNPQGDGAYTLLFRNTGDVPCALPLSVQRALFVMDRSSGSCYRFAHLQGQKKTFAPGETCALSVRLSDLEGFPWSSRNAGCPVKLCWVFFDRMIPFDFIYVPSHHNVIFMRERAAHDAAATPVSE